MRDYQAELEALQNGMEKEMKISSQEFLEFRKAWLKMPEHEKIVGQALEHGDVIYRYLNDKNEK